MIDLTEKQQRVLEFLQKFLATQGMPPTIREIGEAMGFTFPAARGYLQALERKGFLKLHAGKSRGMELLAGAAPDISPDVPDNLPGSLLPERSEAHSLPLAGAIRAGRPITAHEEIESYIAVDRDLFRDPDAFVLRVIGDSMQDAGIFDSDYVVVSQRSEVPQGGIGVAMVGGAGGDEATIKRIYKEGSTIRLVPENSTMQPTEHPAGEISIIGRVTGVIRKL